MTEYLSIKNWQSYQHYKDRNPPWIKLHFELFASADWVMLADASRLLMVVCMMVASRNEGRVPADPHYLKRVAYLDKLPDLSPLIDSGFLEIVQAPASNCKQTQAVARPETETYREEKEKKESNVVPETTAACAKAEPPQPKTPALPDKPPEPAGNLPPLDRVTGKPPTYHATEFHPRFNEVREAIVKRLPNLGRQNATEVNRWLLEGADPEKDIFPTVDNAIEFKRGDIGSFKYFTRGVESSVTIRREMAEQHERLSKKYADQDKLDAERKSNGQAE